MIYCFESFELDLDRLQLRRAGEPVPVQPQVFDVLRHLVEHRHRVVPKVELLDSIWGDRFVSESALSSRIKSVRQALGDDGDRQAFVRTVHGRGFQFVAEVTTSHTTVTTKQHAPVVKVPPSRFVGREADRAGVIGLLAERRLVTIWGTGGVGKTRLALHVAADMANDYPDGVHVVELATMSSDDDVARRVCGQLGVSEQDDSSPVGRLVESLAGQRALVVLDNCEHVVGTAGAIATSLITGTTSVDVLATSRRPLGTDGEQLWSLAPLGLRTFDGADVAPAVELFVDRIRTASPGLDLDGAGHIIESICQRLDGIPLLVELAAARARHVGLPGVLDAISNPSTLDRLEDGQSRHGSIEEMIRWSYDLLSDDQRDVFGALAVFPSWFDLDGSSAVAGFDARSTLWQLADQSLVTTDLSDRRPRYRLLEPIREFARRHQDPDKAGQVRRRHARYACDAISDGDRRLRGPEGIGAMEHLIRLDADAVVAHRELAASGDVVELARLAQGLFIMANERMRSDLYHLFEASMEDDSAVAERPMPLTLAAVGRWQRGDLSGATELLQRAAEVDDADPTVAPFVHFVRGQVLNLSGQWSAAVEAGLRSVELCNGADPLLVAKAYAVCALSSSRGGDQDAAFEYARLMADVAGTSAAPIALAWAAYIDGELTAEHRPEAALSRFDAAAALARDAGSLLVGGAALLSSVSLRCRSIPAETPPLGEFATLIRHWQRAGNWAHQWITLRNLVVALAATDQHEPAAILYGAVTTPRAEVAAHGAEAERLAAAVQRLDEHLGPDRREELGSQGSRLERSEVIAHALGALRSDG